MEIESKASTLQVRPSLDERVAVVAYDPAWPAQAQEEIARLRGVLGHRVREIEHIGSTAVPGLAAKPIIDLQAGIVKPTSVPPLTPILAAAGYEDLGEAGVPGRQYFRRRQPPLAANLHIVWNRKLWRQNLTLRDYLRAYPEEADYYGRQKRDILAQGGSTLLVYSDAKAPILRELIRKAQAWAKQLSGGQADLRDPATWEESVGPDGTSTRQSTLSSAEREADREQALEAFYGALTAAFRLGNEAGIHVGALEDLRQEAAELLVVVRAPSTISEVRGFEDHLRTAGLIYLLDQYRAEHSKTLEPRERRTLKFEVEAWQLHLRDLEDRGRDLLALTPELERIGTKEELADWFRQNEIGRYRLLGR